MDAKQVPLRELLASVPADARLLIDDADGLGSRSIPVGRLCQEAAAALAEPVQGCPSCEYNKQRAQLWRNEAYKLGGHPLDWEPELMVRPKPLTEEEIKRIDDSTHFHESPDWSLRFARAIERAHGIGEKE